MASTNLNTNSESVLSSDIYEIAEFFDRIRRTHIPNVDDTAAMVGLFGYMNEAFSQSLQNALIMASESTNEMIPTRAKFSKNVIAHALNAGVKDINAKPAVMTLMIYLPMNYLENNYVDLDPATGRATFILSSKVPFNIDSHEYHLDYNVIINRVRNANGQFTYTAMYDLFETGTTNVKQQNPISDITNPYITTLVQAELDGVKYLAFSARLHQIFYIPIEKNILTANSIENKTITFDYNDHIGQLASFDIDVFEGDKQVHLTPVYNGLLDYTVEDGSWCYYEYINEKTIRIIFSRDSYVPGLNALVRVNLYLSNGASGNFTYNQTFRTALKSEEYNNYNGMYAYIFPLLDGLSTGGKDAKSISDLKKIIPREVSSRGAIINTTDLKNFFNSINDDECTLFFKKKKDNQFERMYYAYLLMMKNGNVYPTNTINLKILKSQFSGHTGDNNLSINPGTKFYYYDHGSDIENAYASITPPQYYTPEDDTIDYQVTRNADGQYVRVFEYISPFLITVDDDLITSYLLTVMNENKTFRFDSINTASDLQFIATNMQWVRNYYTDTGTYSNKYTMTVDITQNNIAEYNLIKYHVDANGDTIFDDVRVRMMIVLYSDSTATNPYRYAEAELVNYDNKRFTYTFKFTFETDDLMDLNNRINITGVKNAKPEAFQHIDGIDQSHGYMNKDTYAKIFIMADFGTKPGDNAGGIVVTEENCETVLYGDDGIGNRTEIEAIIPTREDIIDAFLNNDLYITSRGQSVNVVYIMRSKSQYISEVTRYNGDNMTTEAAILKYLKNNRNSDFVQNTLLQDPDVQNVINAYSCEDFSRYTVCNVMSVADGIDFYHDYSSMMRSTVTVNPLQETDTSGHPLYHEITRYDDSGLQYTEYAPVYKQSGGSNIYEYTMKRFPVVKAGYLFTESLMQDFINELEERRKYIAECLHVLEDTFDIDFKFVNTFGPSRTFYYDIPSSQNYRVMVNVYSLNVYGNTESESLSNKVGELSYTQEVIIIKVRGQWGYITSPYTGWIKLADTKKVTNYIDNVAIKLRFALQAQTSADKYISEKIIADIKAYIEDINTINEIHIPNIITLITNNYREQLVYFEFLDINGYGNGCQHLYLEEPAEEIADVPPEFINVAVSEDNTFQPQIEIMVY